MATELPYLVTNKRLPDLFMKTQSAGVPEKFTFEFLKKLGFASSNDRGLPSLLKKLGFLDQSGSPTPRYNAYRHKKNAGGVLAGALRELYRDLFALNENAHKAKREDLCGMVSRVTGQEKRYVGLIASTFTALCALADFDSVPADTVPATQEEVEESVGKQIACAEDASQKKGHTIAFRHNIEIHLPATTNIAVYNAIFKSLCEHLLD
jgi:hypothetical protein